MDQPTPKGHVELRFLDPEMLAHVEDPVQEDLSAAARWGDSLFLSCDETAGVERLGDAGDHWGRHVHFNLGALVDLPDGPGGEMDIEGLDCDDGWLWVVGSHALKRRRPKSDDPAVALAELEDVRREANRYFLGRFPLVHDGSGEAPVAADGERRAGHVRFTAEAGKLMDWLAEDPHLAWSLSVPSKENGLDVEGIAARGLRIWLGLRGPVLRGHGVVLELELEARDDGSLKAKRIDGRRRYRKHLLPTAGLGVRDLKIDGEDLLVLAGPTLSAGGPARVLRWRNALASRASGVVPAAEAPVALHLPWHGAVDHPEGILRWGDDWLVVYDSPSARRLEGEGAVVTADVWAIS